MARRHRNGYRFTEKTHSKRGVAALFLSIISIGILVAAVVSSFDSRGNGSMYLGSAGVTSMLIGICALVLAVKSLGEENSFKLLASDYRNLGGAVCDRLFGIGEEYDGF